MMLGGIFTIVVLAAVAGAGVLFFFNGNQENFRIETTSDVEEELQSLEDLKSQLQNALASGGITPEAYEEIDDKIKYFESQGYEEETQELRTMLSQLEVGGDVIESAESSSETSEESTSQESSQVLLWLYRDGEWQKPVGNVPACPDPLVLQAPVDLDLVTSILYPGQVRGGDFKPHGGFRTDGTSGPVEVTAPMDGYIWRVAKFNDSAGLHYMFDVQHPCGIMYRLGHLSAVPAKLEAIFDGFPEKEFGDSRTEEVEPFFVELGETIATDIQHQTGFDWGVYDLRQENEASKDPAFREAYTASDAEQAFNAICWFDYLPPEQEAIVRSLSPADGTQGKNSDYC